MKKRGKRVRIICRNHRSILAALGVLGAFSGCTAQTSSLQAVPQVLPPPPLPRVNIAITNFCPDSSNTGDVVLEDFFIHNMSAIITGNQVLTDYDRDGIPDAIESGDIGKKYGLNPAKWDTNDDGYSDLVVYRSGITAVAQENLKYRYCADLSKHSTADWLSDCEKALLLGLDPQKIDNSSVGLIDGFKLIAGLNPLDPANSYLTTSGDPVDNVTKAKLGIPVDTSTNDFIRPFTPTYKIEKTKSKIGKTPCAEPLNLTASNIVIAPTANSNLIMTFINRRTHDGQRVFDMCCTLVDPKFNGSKTIEVDWSQNTKDDLNRMMCPCPSVKSLEGANE